MSLYRKVKARLESHPTTGRLISDIAYRTVFSATMSFSINIVYAVYNLIIGIASSSAWFVTMCFYYSLLGLMRFVVVISSRKIKALNNDAKIQKEKKLTRNIGIIMLFLMLAVSGTVVLTIRQNLSKVYDSIVMISIATYTFYKVTIAIINWIKIRKHHSLLLSAVRNIGIADAAMSVLSMQTSMIASFDKHMTMSINFMTILTGSGVAVIFSCIGISMLLQSRRIYKWLNQN